MHFSEDDLRSALRQKDPGANFTRKVMVQIDGSEVEIPTPRRLKGPFRLQWWPPNLRATLAAALVLLLAVGGWLAIARYQQAQAGEHARQKAILAMRIANAKLNHVLVRAAQTRSDKIRRERL